MTVSPPSPSAGIILSGAYISASMVSEFGRLPPSFLPMANQRLYEWQIKVLQAHVDAVHLALPEDFVPEIQDRTRLDELKIGIVPIENDVPLGHSLGKCLAALPEDVDDLWLLFGDTLVTEIPSLSRGAVVVGTVQEHSRWGYCRQTEAGAVEFYEKVDADADANQPVVIGCFRFRRHELAQCLTLSGRDFYGALNLYSTRQGLKLVKSDAHWFDFGHLHAYFRSRQNFTTERCFNNLTIEKRKVCKFSTQSKKIMAEAAWYASVPRDMDVFLPGYLGQVRNKDGLLGYATEYLFLPQISDLFVFGALPEYVWRQVLSSCAEFFSACGQATEILTIDEPLLASCRGMYERKTEERLRLFCQARDLDGTKEWIFNGQRLPSLQAIFQEALACIPTVTAEHISVSHGDFHFANIFFDFRSLGVKVVDPRGMVMERPTIAGDHRYDLAKLAHSIDGAYDFIIAGLWTARFTGTYDLSFSTPETQQRLMVQELFQSMRFDGHRPNTSEIRAIVLLLFLSMLPLHADNLARQNALLANVFRLYLNLEA